jgi:hypothetical protein
MRLGQILQKVSSAVLLGHKFTANCSGHLILLSEEEMGRLGHTVEGAARQGKSYIALVEVFHQIHCVDMIRKFIFREHYPDWNALQGPSQGILDHVGKSAFTVIIYSCLFD